MKLGAFLAGLGVGMAAGAAAGCMMPDQKCIRRKAKRAAHELERSFARAMDCLSS